MSRYINALISAFNVYLFYISVNSSIYIRGLNLAAAVLCGIAAILPSE